MVRGVLEEGWKRPRCEKRYEACLGTSLAAYMVIF